MKPISIMWSQGVDPTEAQVAVSAVREFLRLVYEIANSVGLAAPPAAIRPFGTWYIPTVPQGSPYWGTSWYVESSYDSLRKQVVGRRFLDLVRDEPWQKSNPHWDLAVIDRDLSEGSVDGAVERRGDFVLGTSVPELAAVLSVYRLRGLVRPEQRGLALRRLVFHHVGHVLGLPSHSRTQDLDIIDGQSYCTNNCVMRYAPTVEQIVRAAEQEGRDRVALCERCRRDVVEILVLRGRSPN